MFQTFLYPDLQNDLKELLGKIEEGLYKIHADEKMKKSDQKSKIIEQQTIDISMNCKILHLQIFLLTKLPTAP